MVSDVFPRRSSVTRVYLHTFGCKANQYDTEVMRQALEGAGAVSVDDPRDADVAVVNSCTVTHVSEAKMRGLVRRLARGNAKMRTVVTGCAATLDNGSIESLPSVVSVLPGSDPDSLLEALGLVPNAVDPVLRSFTSGSRAWLKIQDGCDEHCTFCATVRARGASRSRSAEQIVEEAIALSSSHEEIVLTGVHVGVYGRDLVKRRSLGSLVELLVSSVPNVRFRLSSIEATELCERLEELMRGRPDRLAPHVHAPLQSGSDKILRRMGRNWYKASEYRERLEQIAAKIPTLGLGADIIVGFPGEDDTDFDATKRLVQSLPYTYLHVFQYSERANTPAVQLGPSVGPETSRERSGDLREQARLKAAAYRTSRRGQEADVVLLGRSKGRFEGLTEDYLPVFTTPGQILGKRFRATLELVDDTLWAHPLDG